MPDEPADMFEGWPLPPTEGTADARAAFKKLAELHGNLVEGGMDKRSAAIVIADLLRGR